MSALKSGAVSEDTVWASLTPEDLAIYSRNLVHSKAALVRTQFWARMSEMRFTDPSFTAP